MCEESNEIKWKCLQCDFLLCTKCQKLHKKVKTTNQHAIIDIEEIASHQQHIKDKLDNSNIPCRIHSGQNFSLFCKSCKEVVCSLCFIQNHNKHNITEFAEGYCLMVDTMKTVNSEKLEQNVGKNVLKEEIENHTKKLLKELDQRREVVMKSVNDAENISQKIIKDLDLRKKHLSQVLNSNNVNQVFGICSEDKILIQPGVNPVNTIFKTWPKFVQGKEEVEDFYLGALIETDNDQNEFIFKEIKQYKTEQNLVENLVSSPDGALWISDFYSHKLHKIKLTNVLLSFKIDIYSMAILPYGNLLMSTMESNLKILSFRSTKIDTTKYSVNPLITLAVHVTNDHKIIVGARENQTNSFPVNGPRQVIMMNIDGKKEIVYHKDNKGKPIFTVPYRITTDNNNIIYVIDVLDEKDNGRIVALDKTNGARWIAAFNKTNKVKWVYGGNPDITKEQTFKPKDLVATKSDNIIVTDDDNHIIHILNTSGQCIYYINTKDQLGIVLPYSVDNDNRGTLYIGCNTYQTYDAKIYTIQVSGF
ncbi:unnamed protein product [Mytilus coruscus]|uniref:B box-type domain-containing protein n=1 Tax=Mytilus coruscus TaxID=42192 RepID=A0A6J8EE65_MYTCO|nr:unnamed protein product [Mytilus coruscus]